MIYGYTRVSTDKQSIESQKNTISRYCVDNKMMIDEWIELEISATKSYEKRKLNELLNKITSNDIIIVTELSRLARNPRDTYNMIHTLLNEKKSRLITLHPFADICPSNPMDVATKITISMTATFADIEREFIIQRTKEGLEFARSQGRFGGKRKGTIQASMYDKDKDRILHLHQLGVSLSDIIKIHLGYGKWLSLTRYIKKIKKLNSIEKGS